MDDWYLNNLVCPLTKSPLRRIDGAFESYEGRTYPIVDGVPVMLVPEAEQTLHVASASLSRSRDALVDESGLYLESLGMSDEERAGVLALARRGSVIDPVVSFMIGATSGNSYRSMIGRLSEYPIPELRLRESPGASFLDIGCNWGRWAIAAARKGFRVVGLDPSLGAIMAARRVARDLKLPIHYVVGDARYLPFAERAFDTAFSYSVLQHFSKPDVALAIGEIARILSPDGEAMIQMPNAFGIRSLYHQARRGFRAPAGFEVRYWNLFELQRELGRIGTPSITVDCFFGLGLQASDAHLMSPSLRVIISLSERLRALSAHVRALRLVADSVYVSARARDTQSHGSSGGARPSSS